MDAERFSTLCRTVATTTGSRRDAARVLAGLAALISGFATTGGEVAAGGCRTLGGRCQRKSDCCAGSVCQSGRCRCQSGYEASGNRCRRVPPPGGCAAGCASGRVCCDGACTDPTRDPNHCGGCGRTCGFREWCDGGVCICQDHTGRCYRQLGDGTSVPGECCPLECRCSTDGSCTC